MEVCEGRRSLHEWSCPIDPSRTQPYKLPADREVTAKSGGHMPRKQQKSLIDDTRPHPTHPQDTTTARFRAKQAASHSPKDAREPIYTKRTNRPDYIFQETSRGSAAHQTNSAGHRIPDTTHTHTLCWNVNIWAQHHIHAPRIFLHQRATDMPVVMRHFIMHRSRCARHHGWHSCLHPLVSAQNTMHNSPVNLFCASRCLAIRSSHVSYPHFSAFRREGLRHTKYCESSVPSASWALVVCVVCLAAVGCLSLLQSCCCPWSPGSSPPVPR